MAEETTTTTTTEEPKAPAEFRVPPYRREDYLTSPEAERGLTSEQMFGSDPEGVTDKKLDEVLGTSDEIVIRTAETDGSVRELDSKGLRSAVKAQAVEQAKAAQEAKDAPPEQEAAGEVEERDPPPEEAEAAPEPEAEAAPEGAEPEKPKKPGKRRLRKDARYRAMEAQLAAKNAELEEYKKAAAAPPPASAGVGEAPKPEDYDDDDKFVEAVQAWGAERDAARDAAHAERHRLAQQAAQQAGDKGVALAVAQDFKAITDERYTAAERAKNNRALEAITSKALPGHGRGKLPVTRYLIDQRAKLEHQGAFEDGAKTSGEVMADMFGEPAVVAAMEDATGNGHILAAIATLDDPMPVIRYLASPEGKTTVEDLDRLSARAPSAVAARVAKLSRRSLPSGPAGPGEPARVDAEQEPRAYRPGNSPRAAARTNPRPGPGDVRPEREDLGDLDPNLQALFDDHVQGRRRSA